MATVSSTPWTSAGGALRPSPRPARDRKSTRLNSSHTVISYAVFCLKKKTCYDHDPQPAGVHRRSHTHRNDERCHRLCAHGGEHALYEGRVSTGYAERGERTRLDWP